MSEARKPNESGPGPCSEARQPDDNTGATIDLTPRPADTHPLASGATADFSPTAARQDATQNFSQPDPSRADPGATADLPLYPVSAESIRASEARKAPADSGATADFPLDPSSAAQIRASEAGKAPADSGATADFPLDPSSAAQIRASEAGKAPPAIPGYEILSELGRGGMGVVYKARQTALNRLVAIKMVLAGGHAGSEQLARFHVEAQAVASLQHPNIIQIHEVSQHEGLPFFLLEYIDGGALDKKLGGLPQPSLAAARMMETLSRAMHFAHQHGVIHRDLKPANVLLTLDGVPKITDFGLAKKLEGDSSQTKSGTLMGTPSYMAPEQARGEFKNLGPLADVHALGAMLYEMLTGRPPYLGASPLETILMVTNQEPLAPSRLVPKLPRDIETICLRCLQKEPQKRYPSGEALAEDLRRFAAGEPILARRVSAPERAWRWCRRNPRVAALTALVLVLMVTAGTSLASMAARTARENELVKEAGVQASKQLAEAVQEITVGNVRRAKDLVLRFDPLVASSPALAAVRDRAGMLRRQIDLYDEFEQRLDNARYYGLFGPRGTLSEAQEHCSEVIGLYDQIEQEKGKASDGMPPLDATRQQLLQEDFFEAFLVSAQVEWELVAQSTDASAQKAAAQKAVAWLDRAEKILPDTWVLHYRRSAFLQKLGDEKRAAADTARVAQLRPTSALDRFWFAFAHHMEGDASKDKNPAKAQQHYHLAIGEYAAVVRARPDHFWAYFDQASCHFRLGELDDAVVGFTMCIQIRPEVPWTYYNRGTILGQQKQFDASIADLTSVLNRKPDFADALCNRGLAYAGLDKTDLALADLNRALEIDPRLSAAYLHRAETYRKMNRPEKAFADYQSAVEIDPQNPAIFAARGNARLALADFSKARDDFAAAIARQPNEPNHYRVHGLASLRSTDFEAAHVDWRELARLLPASEEPKYNTAITFKAQGKYDDALKALGEAIQLKPNDSKSYLFRAQIYHQLGKLNEALADQTFVLTKLKDGRAEVLNDYGDLLRTMGKLPEATTVYQKSIETLGTQTDAYAGAALALQLQGKQDEAEQVFEKLTTVNPGSYRGYLRRAEFRRSLGRWDSALEDCAKAAELDPKSPLPALVRASIQAGRGEFRQAIVDAEEVMHSAPGDGNIYYAAACVYSLASHAAKNSGDEEVATQYADRAAQFICDTMEKGFLDLNFQAYNRMLVDPALEPIRRHPRVIELMPVLGQPAT